MARKTKALCPHRLRLKRRRIEALRLRNQGLSFEEIADRLGYASRVSCYQSMLWELRQESIEAAEGFRTEEMLRLDAMTKALWAAATRQPPDLAALKQLLKVSRRRAELLGLDQPSQKLPAEKRPPPKVLTFDLESGQISQQAPAG